jgi:DNA-directed RNA polymerase beta subunit/predicted GNAT family acetyltransferase
MADQPKLYELMTRAETRRDHIREHVMDGIQRSFVVENDKYRLEVEKFEPKPVTYAPSEQKRALLEGKTLTEPLRGTMILTDKATGKVIDRATKTLVHIPYFTERHTFITGGNDYAISNQMRIKPGVFTRERDNGQLEASFNLAKGKNFRLSMDPAKGVFNMEYATSKLPLYPILIALGLPESRIRTMWGAEVTELNKKASLGKEDKVVRALYDRIVSAYKRSPGATKDEMLIAIKASYDSTVLDPQVTQMTLGIQMTSVNPEGLLRASQKLLHVYNGKEETDDRDSTAFKTLHTAETFMQERIEKDAMRDVKRKVGTKLRRSGDTPTISGIMPHAPFSKSLHSFITSSALAATPMQINPMEIIDSSVKVTSLGEGGISSMLAVPDEARDVHYSHLGMLDPVRTPESGKAGVDIRAALHTKRDAQGNMYAPMKNVKTGATEFLRAEQIVSKTIAFPGQDMRGGKKISAMKNGKVQSVNVKDVDYVIPSASAMYSPTTNLVPFLNSAQGNRNIMGAKFQTQALPLKEREQPFVQVMDWTGKGSVEAQMGRLTIPTAPISGTIEKIDQDFVYIRRDKVKTASEATTLTAVIIKGNPKFVLNNPQADRFYKEIKTYLEDKGFSVEMNDGKAYTAPDQADLWIGHSRGVDRLRFATGMTKTLMFGSGEKGAINHPQDGVSTLDDSAYTPDTYPTPNQYHFAFTEEMKRAIDRVAQMKKTASSEMVGQYTLSTLNDDEVTRRYDVHRDGKNVAYAVTKQEGPGAVLLDGVYVSPEHRGAGLFNTLMDKAEGDNAGSTIRLVPRPYKDGATPVETLVEMYGNRGYAPTGDRNVMAKTAAKKTDDDDDLVRVPRSDHFPLMSKTYVHDDITVKAGDRVTAGQSLGDNNYTKDGSLALGKNMLVAYMPYYGYNSNDAVVISEGAAKKLTSLHMYKESITLDTATSVNKLKHQVNFGAKYDKAQYANLDDTGVIKKGAKVHHGDLLIAGLQKTAPSAKAQMLGNLHKSLVKPVRDAGVTWDHEYEGEIIDVAMTSKQIMVTVKTEEPIQVGDKLAGRAGNKGVVSKIVPDSQMVKDEQGRPIDILMTSAGIISRINPSQILETSLGKVVEKTGKPILVEQFADHDNVEWVKKLMKDNGVKDKERVYDPVSGKHIDGIHVGRQFTMKMFKSTDTNYAARGIGPGYDANLQPSKGGEEGAKSIAKMEFNALLAHNARNILQESAAVKGQRNDEYWRRVQLGLPAQAPTSNFAYDKFGHMLTGAGINVKKNGTQMTLAPLTDKDIDAMAPRSIKNSLLVKPHVIKGVQQIAPERGGLFDPVITGGLDGNKYSKIELFEPVVNPIFEDPARYLLGMSAKDFVKLRNEKGAGEIKTRLNKIDLPTYERELSQQVNRLNGTALNTAVKQLKYVKALRKQGIKAGDAYVLTKVPVTPPIVRPITPNADGTTLVADANYLYRDLMLANDAVGSIPKELQFPDEMVKQRQYMHDAVGALFGTNEPVSPQNQGRGVKGHLVQITGSGSPKTGYFHSKLMRRRQDLSARGTIAPDHTLELDQVGLPEGMAWKMYEPFIVKGLVRNGYSAVDARKSVKDKTQGARRELDKEIQQRPILINRAPTLHRFNMIAANPVLVPGKTIRLNPFAESGMNADYDGDAVQLHVPVADAAVREAQGMTLSNLIFGDKSRDTLMVFPAHEALIGAYMATSGQAKGKERTFKNRDEAMAAYKRGEIQLTTPVKITG